MDASTIVGAAASTVVVVGGLIGVLRWVVRHEIRAVQEQFRPNGGGSFRDHVDGRLDKQDDKMEALGQRVAKIEGALEMKK